MRIAAGIGGEVIGRPMAPSEMVEQVVQAEAEGFGSAWTVHFSRGVEALDILAVAGTRTRTLGEAIVPRLHAAAAGRPAPRVVVALPVALCADEDGARRSADEVFARYTGFDNYRKVLERQGAAAPGKVALVGSESDIERQLKGLEGLGVTELWPILFPAGADPDATMHRTRTLLAELSRS